MLAFIRRLFTIDFIRTQIDHVLAWIKWPVAICMIFCVPATIQSFSHYVKKYVNNMEGLLYFAGGAAFLITLRAMSSYRRGAAETMEHEMTHAFFALLTLHPVHDIKIHDEGGGSMTYSGGGNWLITISPYFFPLSLAGMFFVGACAESILGYTPEWVYIGLGIAAGYYLCSNYKQIHPGQTDFHKVGFLFCFAFLPGANILVYGYLLAFIDRNMQGVIYYTRLLAYFIRKDALLVIEKAMSYL